MAVPRYGKKKPKLPPMFYIIGSLVVLVAVLVIMFVSFVMKDMKKQDNFGSLPSSSSLSSLSSSISINEESDIGISSEPSTISSEPPVVTSDPPPSSSSSVLFIPTEKPPVPMNYLDDALIIGDSISVGFTVYGALPPERVLANRNVSLDKIHLNKKVYSTPQGDLTLYDALNGKNPKKIYILLGSNGIPGLDNTVHITYYEEMLKNVRSRFPESIIYAQSVTPVTAKCENNRPVMNNAKINQFNEMIKEIAPKYGAYYLDIASALKDASGTLDPKYAENDGIHFKAATYQVILNYYLLNAK